MKKRIAIPKFKSQSQEADWWAGRAGRDYVKDRAAEAQLKGAKPAGSRLLTQLRREARRGDRSSN